MSKVKLTKETNLKITARNKSQIALQAEVLVDFEREILNHIEKNPLFTILVSDTIIAENYKNESMCLAWLTSLHRAWLNSNQEFNSMSEQLCVYRYILLPFPSLVLNPVKRQNLIDIILLHIHLQLWHGIVCGIIFLNPQKSKIAKVLHNLNFLAIPSHKTFFETLSFYNGKGIRNLIHKNSQAENQYKSISQMLSKNGSEVMWLHYDEVNFSENQRLSGWRWEMLRQFFRHLYGPILRCNLCHKEIINFALDHIAPFSKGYNQTIINFRPLCKSCNSQKSNLRGENPFNPRFFLPSELHTHELDNIYQNAPKWLGKLKSPTTISDIKKRI